MAIFVAGGTYKEASEQTGIPQDRLRRRGAKEHWSDQRKSKRTKVTQKVHDLVTEKSAQDAAETLNTIKAMLHQIVEKTARMIPQVEKPSDIRALAGALKDLVLIEREVYGILSAKEQIEMEIARERLELEKQKYEQNSRNDLTEVKFVIEYE